MAEKNVLPSGEITWSSNNGSYYSSVCLTLMEKKRNVQRPKLLASDVPCGASPIPAGGLVFRFAYDVHM